jgi:hypothetical protein
MGLEIRAKEVAVGRALPEHRAKREAEDAVVLESVAGAQFVAAAARVGEPGQNGQGFGERRLARLVLAGEKRDRADESQVEPGGRGRRKRKDAGIRNTLRHDLNAAEILLLADRHEGLMISGKALGEQPRAPLRRSPRDLALFGRRTSETAP